jgi:branched-subunit amino acid aminotransferase/4-amino-4-deoxychorismate lyase
MENSQNLIHNGELVDQGNAGVDHSNRAFRYGDSLFETVRIVNGQPRFWENHYARLRAGMTALKMHAPDAFSEQYFLNLLKMLIDRNGIREGGVARVTVYREGGGLYRPISNKAAFLIETTVFESNDFELNTVGLVVDIYEEMSKAVTPFTMYKTGNSLTYVLAALYAQEHQLDDCLLVNERGSLLEATSSNLFIVSNGVLYTPALDEGCVAGTMRMKIINLAISNGIKVYECTLTPQNLLAADEMFLSNAVAGIKWVKSYKNKRYFSKTAKLLIQRLNDGLVENPLPPLVDQSKLNREESTANRDLI